MTNPVGRNANPNVAGGQTFMNNVNSAVGGSEGIVLDGSAMDAQHYKELGALKKHAMELYQNGVDITQAPDITDPKSLQAHELWNAALERFRMNRDRRIETKKNQEYLLKAAHEKNVLFDRGLLDQRFLGKNDILGNSFASTNPFVDKVNQQFRRQPTSQIDAQAQQQAYGDALSQIDEQVQAGNMSIDQGEFLKSQIHRPGGYDNSQDDLKNKLTQAKINTERARAGSFNRANRKDKKTGKADIVNEHPRIVDLARVITGSVPENELVNTYGVLDPKNPQAFTSGFWEGASLHDEGKHMFTGFKVSGNGNYIASFRKTTKNPNALQGEDQNTYERKDVRFHESNILPALEATMSNSEWRQTKKELVNAGLIKGGRLSAKDLLELVGGAGNPQSSPKPFDLQGSFTKRSTKGVVDLTSDFK
ncbi:MAG: hypothetical protein ACQ5SW_10220 [Sphaerochaetaceae bacterium]